MKQKSLMAFFGKSSAIASTATNNAPSMKPRTKEPEELAAKASSSRLRHVEDPSPNPSVDNDPAPPPSKKSSQSSVADSAAYARSSHDAESVRETPPTSDPIDVDMMSVDEEPEKTRSHSMKAVSGIVDFVPNFEISLSSAHV